MYFYVAIFTVKVGTGLPTQQNEQGGRLADEGAEKRSLADHGVGEAEPTRYAVAYRVESEGVEPVAVPVVIDHDGPEAVEEFLQAAHEARGTLGAYLTTKARDGAYRDCMMTGGSREAASQARESVGRIEVTERPIATAGDPLPGRCWELFAASFAISQALSRAEAETDNHRRAVLQATMNRAAGSGRGGYRLPGADDYLIADRDRWSQLVELLSARVGKSRFDEHAGVAAARRLEWQLKSGAKERTEVSGKAVRGIRALGQQAVRLEFANKGSAAASALNTRIIRLFERTLISPREREWLAGRDPEPDTTDSDWHETEVGQLVEERSEDEVARRERACMRKLRQPPNPIGRWLPIGPMELKEVQTSGAQFILVESPGGDHRTWLILSPAMATTPKATPAESTAGAYRAATKLRHLALAGLNGGNPELRFPIVPPAEQLERATTLSAFIRAAIASGLPLDLAITQAHERVGESPTVREWTRKRRLYFALYAELLVSLW